MRALFAVGLVLVLPAFVGCVDERGPSPRPGPSAPVGPRLGEGEPPVFSESKLIDEMRAGGEPVITITPKGTIMVSAHPGYTHYHPEPGAPTGPELLIPSQTQSYLWRSADKGQTWKDVSLLPVDSPNSGPRGVGQGVSDPDFTVDANGRIYLTDLEALADASVSWSDDDGVTWLEGNNDAAGGVVDRQWLASFGTTLYFRGNGVNDVRKSEDGGRTFTNVGDAGCGGDMVAHPVSGKLYVGCGLGFSLSTDGGQTWKQFKPKGAPDGAGHGLTEPAIDSAGNVYVSTDPGYEEIVTAWTPDDGVTWSNLSLKPYFPELAEGTLLWPWTSAGSEGRFSVTFYASPRPDATADVTAEWFVYTAIILNATTPSPEIYPVKVTPGPFHVGAICQRGTQCQTSTATDDLSDRRLGDFFETTIDSDGVLYIVHSNTAEKPADTISHVAFEKLVSGPRLVEGSLPKGFPTQG